MEDVRIGRKTSCDTLGVTVGAASVPVVPADPMRYAIIFSPPAAGRITLSIKNPAVLDQGITLHALASPEPLNIQEHGTLVTAAWYAIADMAGRALGVATSQLAEK